MTTQDVAPGIYRIESILGPRPFAQYLLRDERSLLVDTGIVSTPDEVILPAFQELGLDPADLDYVLISHADVDHFGGNAAIRAAAPRAVVCAHVADCAWIGDRERILSERYGWYAAHGAEADYDADTKDWLRNALGPDVPVDLHLVGGEVFRLGPNLSVEVLHLPGHSLGHIGLWDPGSRSAIITDAALGAGLLNNEGQVIHPPPYVFLQEYKETVHRLRALEPERLLTAHYAVMEGIEVDRFLDESLAFVARARSAIEDAIAGAEEVTLAGLLTTLNPVLGPFTSMAIELGSPIRAHLGELVASGRIEEIADRQPPAWRARAR
ncbi:MAG TPA: MBL fold metallo-hydrolase [Thermomicrobiales bacterium]|nr:MBL fold metallo-hydrolase [Thermomicrobiales bacterium]